MSTFTPLSTFTPNPLAAFFPGEFYPERACAERRNGFFRLSLWKHNKSFHQRELFSSIFILSRHSFIPFLFTYESDSPRHYDPEQRKNHSIYSYLIIYFPMSSGVSEWASEWMKEHSGVCEHTSKRCGQMSEQCEQTSKQTSEWPSAYVWILDYYSGP